MNGARLTIRGCGVALLAVWLWAASAKAQPGAEEVAVAQQLYQDARKHQENKQWASCETALRRAIGILETPGLRFHLAFCKEQQHRWVEALVDYRRAAELIEGGVEAPDVAALLPGAIAYLEEQTPRLSLFVDDAPADTQLYLDGKKVSPELLGTLIPVDPGLRRVEVAAPSHVPFTQAINLLAKDRRELRIALVPDRATAAPDEVPEPEESASQPRSAPTQDTSGGVGRGIVLATEGLLAVTALGIGVGFTFEADSRQQDRDSLLESIGDASACSGSSGEDPLCPEVRAADEDARSARDIAKVGFIAASVATAAMLTTWLLWPDADEPDDVAAGWSVGLSPSGAGVGYSGVF